MHWRHTSYAIVTHEKVTAFYLLQTKAHLRARDAGWSLSQPLFPCYPLINHIMHCNLQLYNCSSLSIFSRGDRPRVGVGGTCCPGKMHLSHVCKINPGLHSWQWRTVALLCWFHFRCFAPPNWSKFHHSSNSIVSIRMSESICALDRSLAYWPPSN